MMPCSQCSCQAELDHATLLGSSAGPAVVPCIDRCTDVHTYTTLYRAPPPTPPHTELTTP